MDTIADKLAHLAETKRLIRDAIVAKGVTMPDDTAFREYASMIESIPVSGGGGSSADVRYVTFMSYDGSVEYGKKAVAVGDDCANPISRGVFDTPTRESTDQYNYTFAGWSTVENGGLDADALKAVNEDRTVYANFAAVLRTYLITFLDEDGTKLTEKTVAYGSIPSYTPAKDGYNFVGWNPAPVEVTGSATYTAVWMLKPSFATASWEQIVSIANAGTVLDNFSIGDEKDLVLNYADGTSETVTVALANANCKTLTEGRVSTTANAVFVTKTPLTRGKYKMADGYGKSYYSYTGGVRSALNTDIFEALPTELAGAIRTIYHTSGCDPLWVPTYAAISGDMVFSPEMDVSGAFNGEPYILYQYGTTTPLAWFTKDSISSSGFSFYKYIDESGVQQSPGGNESKHIVFGFYI